jgi:hypothetical protein
MDIARTAEFSASLNAHIMKLMAEQLDNFCCVIQGNSEEDVPICATINSCWVCS